MTFSCHHCLGLPTGLVPIGVQSNSFLIGLIWSILWICPSHLILCALMNLTISAPSINLSISMLFRIIYIFLILTRPNIFRSICLSKMRRLFSYFVVRVQVPYKYVKAGLIIILYIFILVFFFSNFDFISFDLLLYNRCKSPTCFGHLLWPSSGRCFYKGYITKKTQPVYKYRIIKF